MIIPKILPKRRTLHAAATPVAAPFLLCFGFGTPPAHAQGLTGPGKTILQPSLVVQGKKVTAPKPQNPPAGDAKSTELPPRVPYTAAEALVAAIPGMPEARFWADSEADVRNALPQEPGAWLIISSGGSDGASGAGLLNGLTAAGKRPDYAVVTGVSTGALMAPFIFAGQRFDAALHKAYTEVTAADVFEAGGSTGESFVDSWPLREFIAKQITPQLMGDIAAAHRAGR